MNTLKCSVLHSNCFWWFRQWVAAHFLVIIFSESCEAVYYCSNKCRASDSSGSDTDTASHQFWCRKSVCYRTDDEIKAFPFLFTAGVSARITIIISILSLREGFLPLPSDIDCCRSLVFTVVHWWQSRIFHAIFSMKSCENSVMILRGTILTVGFCDWDHLLRHHFRLTSYWCGLAQ